MSKIGVTTNPRARLAQLRTGSAFPIDYALIGATPGSGYDIEQAAHAMLGHHRANGEWFDVTPEVAISALMAAAGKLGKPIQVVSLDMADKVLSVAAGGEIEECDKGSSTAAWVFIISSIVMLAFLINFELGIGIELPIVLISNGAAVLIMGLIFQAVGKMLGGR